MINGGWSSVQKKGDYIRVGTMLAHSAEHFVPRKEASGLSFAESQGRKELVFTML